MCIYLQEVRGKPLLQAMSRLLVSLMEPSLRAAYSNVHTQVKTAADLNKLLSIHFACCNGRAGSNAQEWCEPICAPLHFSNAWVAGP